MTKAPMPDDELNMAIKQLFLDGIAWGRSNPYGTRIPKPKDVPGIQNVRTALAKREAETKQEARAERFSDYLQSLEPVDAMNLLAATAYLYVMEPTNTDSFKTKLHGFNRNGKILGDFTISVRLAPPNEEKGADT